MPGDGIPVSPVTANPELTALPLEDHTDLDHRAARDGKTLIDTAGTGDPIPSGLPLPDHSS